MDFQGLNLDINRLTRVRDGLRDEVLELTKERDKAREEIRDQRRGKTEVQSEAVALQSLYDFVQDQIGIAEKTRDRSLSAFSLTYDKQNAILDTLNKLIASKAVIAESFEKTAEDVKSMQEKLLEAKKELDSTKAETGIFASEAERMEKLLNAQIAKKFKLIAEIEEGKRFLAAEKESMRELESKIKRDHERLTEHKKQVKESLKES